MDSPKPRMPPPIRPRHEQTFGLRHKLLLSLLFIAILALVGFLLKDARRPLTNSQIKGFIAAALCVILLAALWIPPVGRLLLRLFGR